MDTQWITEILKTWMHLVLLACVVATGAGLLFLVRDWLAGARAKLDAKKRFKARFDGYVGKPQKTGNGF